MAVCLIPDRMTDIPFLTLSTECLTQKINTNWCLKCPSRIGQYHLSHTDKLDIGLFKYQ